MPPLRVAAVGAGHYARFHLAAWARLPGVETVAVCDSDPARAAAAAARFAIPQTFTDAAAMLDAVRPDLIDIVTPPATHAGLVALAAARGVDVVCQKAFCTALAEAEAPSPAPRPPASASSSTRTSASSPGTAPPAPPAPPSTPG